MEKSVFQFSDPCLRSVSFQENTDFCIGESEDSVNMPVSINTSAKREESSSAATVFLNIEIGAPSDEFPFFISVEMYANFRWDASQLSDEQIASFLDKNASALLLSYIRPIISNITNASSFQAYNLPFINLTQEQSEQ